MPMCIRTYPKDMELPTFSWALTTVAERVKKVARSTKTESVSKLNRAGVLPLGLVNIFGTPLNDFECCLYFLIGQRNTNYAD